MPGSLKQFRDEDGNENITYRNVIVFFQILSRLKLSNVGAFPWSWIPRERLSQVQREKKTIFAACFILGDLGADKGGEGKWKKRKERQEEPLGTIPYPTSSKRSPPFWLLIGARKTQVFFSSHRSLLFFVPYIFFRPFRLPLVTTICPWVSEDARVYDLHKKL